MHPTVRAIPKVMPSIICWLSEASSFPFLFLLLLLLLAWIMQPSCKWQTGLCGPYQHLVVLPSDTATSLVPVAVAVVVVVVVESRSNSATSLQLCGPSWGRLMREMCVTQRQLSNDKRIEASAGSWRRAHAQALYSELNQMELPAQLFSHEPNYTGCMRSCSCSCAPSSATLLIKKFVRAVRKRGRERGRGRQG